VLVASVNPDLGYEPSARLEDFQSAGRKALLTGKDARLDSIVRRPQVDTEVAVFLR
jgi:hypothetical protein